MVGSHHTKDLDLELRIEPNTYARTVAEACKTNTGRDPDVDILTPKLDPFYQIVSKIFSS